jgi:hypothetical protein
MLGHRGFFVVLLVLASGAVGLIFLFSTSQYIGSRSFKSCPCSPIKAELSSKSDYLFERNYCSPQASDIILSTYEEVLSRSRNVYHMMSIYNYASIFGKVTQLGFRDSGSLWAFAKAGRDRAQARMSLTYRQLDSLESKESINIGTVLLECPSINYSFIQGPDFIIEPWPTEVLMMEATNIQIHLSIILDLWHPVVQNYIIVSWAGNGSDVGDNTEPEHAKTFQTILIRMQSFTEAHEEWSVHDIQRFSELLILKRVAATSEGVPAGSGLIDKNREISSADKIRTDVVIFVPSPVPWEERRQRVYTQFAREGWQSQQAILVFVFGTKAGIGLSESVDTSGIAEYPGVRNAFTCCRDEGDEPNNPDDTSSTTCKVYEALKYIARHYESRCVVARVHESCYYYSEQNAYRRISTLSSILILRFADLSGEVQMTPTSIFATFSTLLCPHFQENVFIMDGFAAQSPYSKTYKLRINLVCRNSSALFNGVSTCQVWGSYCLTTWLILLRLLKSHRI